MFFSCACSLFSFMNICRQFWKTTRIHISFYICLVLKPGLYTCPLCVCACVCLLVLFHFGATLNCAQDLLEPLCSGITLGWVWAIRIKFMSATYKENILSLHYLSGPSSPLLEANLHSVLVDKFLCLSNFIPTKTYFPIQFIFSKLLTCETENPPLLFSYALWSLDTSDAARLHPCFFCVPR